MIKDVSLVWWDAGQRSEELDSARSTDPATAARGGTGAYCYADAGRRYALGSFPTGDVGLFANNRCR
jgi:hypothetical protein